MHQALLVGLPASGKTTFVAALWHVIASRDVAGALALEVLDPPTEHLNTLRNRWLRGEETHRTASSAENIATIRVRPENGDPATEIVVPDLAGESIRLGLVDRQWTASFSEFVRGSTGVLLFVHPGTLVDAWSITDAQDIAGEEVQSPMETDAADESAESEWHANLVPSQVKLVDLLQLFCKYIDKERFRLAIIVSAWDVVDDQGLPPSEWLTRELPLLDQFLISARSRLDFRVYGVSAQGGQLPKDVDRLRAYTKASDRIQVVLDDSSPTHDITAPIRWALNVDRE